MDGEYFYNIFMSNAFKSEIYQPMLIGKLGEL